MEQLLNFAEDGTAEAEEQSAEKRQATRLFELLDREDDDRLEFPDLMMFLFTMEPEMTQEQKLRRSFKLCDQNQSGKISKVRDSFRRYLDVFIACTTYKSLDLLIHTRRKWLKFLTNLKCWTWSTTTRER